LKERKGGKEVAKRVWVTAQIGAIFGFLPVSEPGLIAGGKPGADSLVRDTLRLLTWNVHKNADLGWKRDFNRLLDEFRPDIVHLQEARIDSMMEAFSGREDSWCWMASPNLSLPSSGSSVGAFTAARSALQEGAAMLSDLPEPIFGTRKPMLRCGLPVRGSPPILCLNIHSLNFSLGLVAYSAQLDSMLSAAVNHRGPILVSGDFNTWNRWRMDLLLQKMEALGLKKVDFEGQAPMTGWVSAKSLDHVFYSPGPLLGRHASARILDSIRSSDHAPLVVEFIP
jgi:endonuclease/exonuclease/phosphatase (EEP) superfamily protein YafD